MVKSKPAGLKTKGAAPSCRERRSYVSWPAGCQSSGKEGGLKQGLHGKVKTRTLKGEGCGTQLQGEVTCRGRRVARVRWGCLRGRGGGRSGRLGGVSGRRGRRCRRRGGWRG